MSIIKSVVFLVFYEICRASLLSECRDNFYVSLAGMHLYQYFNTNITFGDKIFVFGITISQNDA